MFEGIENACSILRVQKTPEFDRIFNLPRRIIDLNSIPDVTPLFARPGAKRKFRPLQSLACIEAAENNGLIAILDTGHGKTLVSLALPEAMDSKRAVLFVPSGCYDKTLREADDFLKDFYLPMDRLTILTYDDLSNRKKADILEKIFPDLIILDEGHNLKNMSSSRGIRFQRYLVPNWGRCRIAFLTATSSLRSIMEDAHFFEAALREKSPYPRDYYELLDWAGALDANPKRKVDPGALKAFCRPGEDYKEAFSRRLRETPGVIAVDDHLIDIPLYLQAIRVDGSDGLKKVMKEVRDTWEIDGNEMDYAIEIINVLRQVICGFYYKEMWPNGEKDWEYVEARRAWLLEVGKKKKYAGPNMDSYSLLLEAAERYFQWKQNGGPRPKDSWASNTYPAWRAQHKTKKPPPKKAIWLDDYLVEMAGAWASENPKGIIWYWHDALGVRLEKILKLPRYGSGKDASTAKEPNIICSIKAQGTGKNLQYFYSRNLLLNVPPNGQTIHQLISRTHRVGQEDDFVTLDYPEHELSESAFEQAYLDSKYQQTRTTIKQKLLLAEKRKYNGTLG